MGTLNNTKGDIGTFTNKSSDSVIDNFHEDTLTNQDCSKHGSN